MPKLLKSEVEHWLERGKGTCWFIEREDGFDVYLKDPVDKRATKVTR